MKRIYLCLVFGLASAVIAHLCVDSSAFMRLLGIAKILGAGLAPAVVYGIVMSICAIYEWVLDWRFHRRLDGQLADLMRRAKSIRMTCAMRLRQRVSFAYGNLQLSGSNATKADVERAVATDCPCCNGVTEGLSAGDQELAAAGDCYCPEGCPNA